jgi:hypothetical protein
MGKQRAMPIHLVLVRGVEPQSNQVRHQDGPTSKTIEGTLLLLPVIFDDDEDSIFTFSQTTMLFWDSRSPNCTLSRSRAFPAQAKARSRLDPTHVSITSHIHQGFEVQLDAGQLTAQFHLSIPDPPPVVLTDGLQDVCR